MHMTLLSFFQKRNYNQCKTNCCSCCVMLSCHKEFLLLIACMLSMCNLFSAGICVLFCFQPRN